jgi:hypothetical protein
MMNGRVLKDEIYVGRMQFKAQNIIMQCISPNLSFIRIQDFKLGGAHLKKLRRAEGGAKIFGVFRVKNNDFTPKNHISSNCGGRREICLGVSCELTFICYLNIFFTFDYNLWDGGRHTFLRAKTNFN